MEERLQRQLFLTLGMGCFVAAVLLERGTTRGLLRTLSTILPLLLIIASVLAMGIPYGKKNAKQQQVSTAFALAIFSGALLIPNIITIKSGIDGLIETALFIFASTCYVAAARSVLKESIKSIIPDAALRKDAILAATFSVAGACGLYLYNSLILYSIIERIPQTSTTYLAFLIVLPIFLLSTIAVAAALLLHQGRVAGLTLFCISGVIQLFFLAYAAQGFGEGAFLLPLTVLLLLICALALAFHIRVISHLWRKVMRPDDQKTKGKQRAQK
jgi:hypothetical protein